jgi:hypothetical protein
LPEEVQQLLQLVEESKPDDWVAKADALGSGRTAKAVQQRWRREAGKVAPLPPGKPDPQWQVVGSTFYTDSLCAPRLNLRADVAEYALGLDAEKGDENDDTDILEVMVLRPSAAPSAVPTNDTVTMVCGTADTLADKIESYARLSPLGPADYGVVTILQDVATCQLDAEGLHQHMFDYYRSAVGLLFLDATRPKGQRVSASIDTMLTGEHRRDCIPFCGVWGTEAKRAATMLVTQEGRLHEAHKRPAVVTQVHSVRRPTRTRTPVAGAQRVEETAHRLAELDDSEESESDRSNEAEGPREPVAAGAAVAGSDEEACLAAWRAWRAKRSAAEELPGVVEEVAAGPADPPRGQGLGVVWEAQFVRLAMYKVAHGECSVDSLLGDPRLGSWVYTQRQLKRRLDRGEASDRLTVERVARLTALGLVWEPPKLGGIPKEVAWEAVWEGLLARMAAYKATHGAADASIHLAHIVYVMEQEGRASTALDIREDLSVNSF